MKYQVIKTITPEQGWSAAFRQHRATHSHCQFIHGYALGCEMIFGADDLDSRNWVIDFGGFKDLRTRLEAMFDHKTVVATDDPALALFLEMEKRQVMDLTILPKVGCEAFAEIIFDITKLWLKAFVRPDVRLLSVEVREHRSNAARVVAE